MSATNGTRRRVRAPVHAAAFGNSYQKRGDGSGYERIALCGAAGLTWPRPIKKLPGHESPRRMTVKHDNVTCEECLVELIRRAIHQLHARERETGRPVNVQRALRNVLHRHTVDGLRKLVGV